MADTFFEPARRVYIEPDAVAVNHIRLTTLSVTHNSSSASINPPQKRLISRQIDRLNSFDGRGLTRVSKQTIRVSTVEFVFVTRPPGGTFPSDA